MPVPRPVPATLESQTEAYQTLLARAQRRTGRVPPELVARHVVSVTRGADWPVQRDALEALLRRFAFGRADRLEIVVRPPKGRGLGLYTTRRSGSATRPYRTLLRGIGPLDGSCDCADFLRTHWGSASICSPCSRMSPPGGAASTRRGGSRSRAHRLSDGIRSDR